MVPNFTMGNHVKAIESFSMKSAAKKSNDKQMKSLKKQLRSQDSDINKLRQSIILPETMFAPIHAAVLVDSVEILQHLLDTNHVDLGSLAICGGRGRNKTFKYGVLDFALLFCETSPNIEIVALLLEHVEDITLVMMEQPGIGSLPICLVTAMYEEYLDILDLLLTKTNLVKTDTFSPFYCLAYAILRNKIGVFYHLLQRPEAIASVDQCLPIGGRDMTLLNFAREHNRTQMCEQLEMLTMKGEVSDQSGIIDNKNEVNCEEDENELVEFIASCWNLKNQNSEVANSVKNDNETEYPIEIKVSDITCSSEEKIRSTDKNDDMTEIEDSNNANKKACWQCGISSKYKCVGCRKARYCSEECQLENWPGHKGYCLVKMNKIAFREFRSMPTSIFQ